MRLQRFRLSTLLAIVACLAIAIALVPAVWRLVSLDWVDDAYALWGAGEMVVNYMEDHDGRWPKGWDDLKPYFDTGRGRVAGWSFDKYQRRVAIRWDIDPAVLEAAAKANPRPTFEVIWAKEWQAGTIGDHEPNEILYRYFRGRTNVSDRAKPSAFWAALLIASALLVALLAGLLAFVVRTEKSIRKRIIRKA